MTEPFTFNRVLEYYFTPVQIAKIQHTRIGVAGAGGLGSNCAVNLVRCGFRRFIIADFDTVEVSNLNRQAYTFRQVGKQKVIALHENLLKINPDLDIVGCHEKLDTVYIRKIFKSVDVVIEAFDNPADKALITELFAYSGKFFVCASGVAGIGDSDRITTHKISDTFYIVGDRKSEVTEAVKPFAPCVAVAAAKQADLVLEWVVHQAGNIIT